MQVNASPPPPEGYVLINIGAGFGGLIGPLYRRENADGASTGFRVLEQHANGLRNAHGGMLMALADMAWGHVVAFECSSYWATVRLTCDFLSAARIGDWVEAQADVLSREDDLFITRGRVWSGDRLLMTGTGVFKPIAKRDPRPGEKAFRAARGG